MELGLSRSDYVIIVTALFALPLFILNARETRYQQRLEQTAQLAELLQSLHLGTSRANLLRSWTQYDLDAIGSVNPSKAAMEKFVNDVVKANPELVVDLNNLDEFFKLVLICVDTNGCDPPSAKALFTEIASGIYCLYSPAFPEIGRRLQIEDFGRSLKDLALWEPLRERQHHAKSLPDASGPVRYWQPRRNGPGPANFASSATTIARCAPSPSSPMKEKSRRVTRPNCGR